MDVKPKIILTEEYLAMINRFYNTQIGPQLLNWPCFSQPQMTSHMCNISAKLPGGQDCDYCEHIPYRECSVMCYIHHFCLAAFAARLNLQYRKDADIKTIIADILKKWKYPTLNKRIVNTLDLLSENGQIDESEIIEWNDKEDPMPEVPEQEIKNESKEAEQVLPEFEKEVADEVTENPEVTPVREIQPPPIWKIQSSSELDQSVGTESKEEMSVKPKKTRKSKPIPENCYSVSQIAERFDCSEGLVYRYISEGAKAESGELVKLQTYKEGTKHFIKQEDLEAFEKAGIKRRRRRRSKPEAEKDGILNNGTGEQEI